MFDYIVNLGAKIAGFDLAVISVYVLSLNVFLSGLAASLDMIKDKTKTKFDNDASDGVHKLLGLMVRSIDFIGANRKHKPEVEEKK